MITQSFDNITKIEVSPIQTNTEYNIKEVSRTIRFIQQGQVVEIILYASNANQLILV